MYSIRSSLSLLCVTLSVTLLLCLCLSCNVDAKKHSTTDSHARMHGKQHHKREHAALNWTDSTPNNPVEMTPERIAFFNQITESLRVRNYSRPHHHHRQHDLSESQPKELDYRGVDISAWCGEDTWSCLKSNGYSFAIVRNYMESCEVDPNGVHSVANAWAAGISHVDIYLYPSYTCGTSAQDQVNAAIDSMGSIPFGQLWFDIESAGAAGADVDHAWLKEGVGQAVSRLGQSRVGIYSSAYGWSVAMGDYSDMSFLPIWYAHYDNNPSFSDWQDFAGWTHPAMKQFEGDAHVCGFDVDLNAY